MISHVCKPGGTTRIPIEEYLTQHGEDFVLALSWIDRGNTPTNGAPENNEPLAQLRVVQDQTEVTLRLTQVIAALTADQRQLLDAPVAA